MESYKELKERMINKAIIKNIEKYNDNSMNDINLEDKLMYLQNDVSNDSKKMLEQTLLEENNYIYDNNIYTVTQMKNYLMKNAEEFSKGGYNDKLKFLEVVENIKFDDLKMFNIGIISASVDYNLEEMIKEKVKNSIDKDVVKLTLDPKFEKEYFDKIINEFSEKMVEKSLLKNVGNHFLKNDLVEEENYTIFRNQIVEDSINEFFKKFSKENQSQLFEEYVKKNENSISDEIAHKVDTNLDERLKFDDDNEPYLVEPKIGLSLDELKVYQKVLNKQIEKSIEKNINNYSRLSETEKKFLRRDNFKLLKLNINGDIEININKEFSQLHKNENFIKMFGNDENVAKKIYSYYADNCNSMVLSVLVDEEFDDRLKIKNKEEINKQNKMVNITKQEIKFKGNDKDYTCAIEKYNFGKYGNLESVNIFDNKKRLVHFLCGNTINKFVEDSWYVHDKSDDGKIAQKMLFEKGYLENTNIDKETFNKIKIEIIEDKNKNIGFKKADDLDFIYDYLKNTIRKDYQENFLEKFDIDKNLKETTESILQIYMKNENIKDYVRFEDRISEITSVVRKNTDIIMKKILDENSDEVLKTIICNNIKQLGLTSDNNNHFERSDRTYYAPVEFDINTDNGLSEAKQLLKSKSEEIVDIHLNKIYKEIYNDEELEKFIKKEVSHIGEKYFNFQNDVYALCREEKEEEIKFGRNREINFCKDKESYKRQIEFIIGLNLEDKRIENLQNYYNEKHNIKDMEQHKNELMSYNKKEVVNEKETNKHILVEEKNFGYCGDF